MSAAPSPRALAAAKARRLSEKVDEVAVAKHSRVLSRLVFANNQRVYCAADVFVIVVEVVGDLDEGESRPLAKSMVDHHAKVHDVAVSPDGGLVVSACDDKTVVVWRAVGKELKQQTVLAGHREPVLCCAVSPDGHELASGGADNRILVWDVASGKRELELRGHLRAVNCLAFSPGGNRLVSGSVDRTVVVWNLRALGFQKQRRVFEGHTGAILTCVFSPNGQFVASGGEDKTIRVWDLEVQSVVKRTLYKLKQEIRPKCQELKGHNDYVTGVLFLPTGALASCSRDGTVNVWDIKSRTVVWRAGRLDKPLIGLSASPDGKVLVGGREDTSLVYWDMQSASTKEKIQERVLNTPRRKSSAHIGRHSLRTRITG